MKTFFAIALLAGSLAFALAIFGQDSPAAPCRTCAQKAAVSVAPVPSVPPELANLSKGRIENLMPLGMLIALGCETCAAQAVQWALAQGSTPRDVDAALRTVATVQRLDCFNHQFGPETFGRMEKPLAAARRALEQAAGNQ